MISRECARVGIDDHVVVVQMRHGPTAVTVEAERESPDHEGLKVVHEIPAHETGRVRDLRAQEEARRFPRPARNHDYPRAEIVRHAVDIAIPHTPRLFAGGVEEYPLDVTVGTDLAPTRSQSIAQRR